MKPRIRAENDVPEVLPDGWVAQPIGLWGDTPSVVLYDHRRFDVMMVRGRHGRSIDQALEVTGWEPHAWDGASNTMWIHDRVAAAREALTRSPEVHTPSPGMGVEVPGL